jgi:hypothetical protein
MEKVSDAVRQEKSRELANAEIEAIKQALAKGESWENIVETYSAAVLTPRPFSRRQQYIAEAQGNSEEFAKIAFNLQDGEYSEFIELADDYAIIRVKERIGIDPEKFEKEKDTLTQKLLRQKQDTVFQEYIEELRQNADIKYAENLFS